MNALRLALTDAILYAAKLAGDAMPPDLAEQVSALKTLEYYRRTAERLARQLYNGDITSDAFQDSLLDVMDAQLTRAWNEGMRENGLDPAKDMTPEDTADLERFKLQELDHIPDFAAAITDAAATDAINETPGASLPAMYARADLWAARYPDIVNTAILLTADDAARLEWVLGATEEHCETCNALNGIVASADEWYESGFQPQSPPNNSLECGGWRCLCSLVPTDKRRTRDRLERFDSLKL